MKIAILGESSADALAMLEFAAAILGFRPELVEEVERNWSAMGWHSVRRNLPLLIRALHFRTDAEGLIVLGDSNGTSLLPGAVRNRREELVTIAEDTLRGLGPVHGRPRLRVAIAIAAPAIEAWLLCKQRSNISEAAWEQGIADGSAPYTKQQLKIWLHGVQRPTTPLRIEQMLAAAKQNSAGIQEVCSRFPNGFGKFYQDLLDWRSLKS